MAGKIKIKLVGSSSSLAKVGIESVKGEAKKRGITITDRNYDIVVVVGGDGTLLQAATMGKPVVAIMGGRRCHLLDIPHNKIADVFGRLLKGDYSVSRYPLLEVRHGDKKILAFNEMGIVSVQPQTIVVSLSFEQINMEVEGDGMLVATPQGSTGWALSANEVYVDRRIRGMIVAMLNPVLMPIKALVLPETQITMELGDKGYEEFADLVADGRKITTLKRGDRVYIKRAAKDAIIYRFFKRDPVKTLLHGSGVF